MFVVERAREGELERERDGDGDAERGEGGDEGKNTRREGLDCVTDD